MSVQCGSRSSELENQELKPSELAASASAKEESMKKKKTINQRKKMNEKNHESVIRKNMQ